MLKFENDKAIQVIGEQTLVTLYNKDGSIAGIYLQGSGPLTPEEVANKVEYLLIQMLADKLNEQLINLGL